MTEPARLSRASEVTTSLIEHGRFDQVIGPAAEAVIAAYDLDHSGDLSVDERAAFLAASRHHPLGKSCLGSEHLPMLQAAGIRSVTTDRESQGYQEATSRDIPVVIIERA